MLYQAQPRKLHEESCSCGLLWGGGGVVESGVLVDWGFGGLDWIEFGEEGLQDDAPSVLM